MNEPTLKAYLESIRAGAQELLNTYTLKEYQAELVLDLLQFANAALELEKGHAQPAKRVG